jgi:surfeit locus 1 family protein
MRRYIFPILLGLVGIGVLLSLGIWQVQRMQWKAEILADINARLMGAAQALPAAPNPADDKYRPVFAQGRFTGERLFVISGMADVGGGVQVIAVLQTNDNRRIMVDRGFVPDQDKTKPLTVTDAKIEGNLHWPDETTTYTPPPDSKTGLWFARDVAGMAAQLNTEPVLIVARAQTGDGIFPRPVDSSTIPNDHWGYAITWFLLAATWAVMTLALIWRIHSGASKGRA